LAPACKTAVNVGAAGPRNDIGPDFGGELIESHGWFLQEKGAAQGERGKRPPRLRPDLPAQTQRGKPLPRRNPVSESSFSIGHQGPIIKGGRARSIGHVFEIEGQPQATGCYVGPHR
jgi:hypothetical protein